MNGFDARYFDGRQAIAHPVRVTIDGGQIDIVGATDARSYPLAGAEISERLASAPRLIAFADGSRLEATDHASVDAALARAGWRDGWIVRWQNRWPYALVALAATLASLVLAWLYVVPLAATLIAQRIPSEFEAAIGTRAVTWVDHRLLAPSKLPPARQEELARRFAAIVPADGRDYRVEFRAGRRIGANALALPGGLIVMTDELVALAPNDDAVLAVLAHELGHIERGHFLRRLVGGTLTGAAATLLVGDVSGVVAAIPATLADLSYSRDMEREADAYAAALLRTHGLDPEALVVMLERLEQAHRGASAAKTEQSDWTDYVGSHPPTAERSAAIRAAPAPAGH